MRTLLQMIRTHSYAFLGVLLLLGVVAGVALIPADDAHGANIPLLKVSKSGTRPNIIFIRTDDQDYGSVYTKLPNSTTYVMQNLHNLIIDKGVTFTHSFAEFPLCCPSRVTTLTGQYAKNHGILDNIPPNGGYQTFTNDTDALPVWLQSAGYYTIHVGKYLNGYDVSPNPPYAAIPPGWTKWYTLDNSTGNVYYGYNILEDGPVYRTFGSGAVNYQTDVLTQKTLAYITDQNYGSNPFYLQLDFSAPHGTPVGFGLAVPAPRHVGMMTGAVFPFAPSYNEADVSDKPAAVNTLPLITNAEKLNLTQRYRKRHESLMAVDEAIARIVQKLKQTGQYDNTIIIFAGDNGWMEGQHRIEQGKQVSYEESVKVPLFIAGAGIPQNITINSLVNTVDYVPTILEWAQATPTLQQEGRSLMPLMQNPSIPWRTDFLIENPLLDFYSGLRTQDPTTGAEYKYVEYTNTGEVELYALTPDACSPSGDPYELDSQHNNPCYTTIKQNLHTLLMQRLACVGTTCR